MASRVLIGVLLALLLGSVPSLAQTPVTIVGPITVGNCVQFFSPVQIKDAGVVCGGAAGAVQSVGNFAADTSLTIAGVGTGPWNGAVTVKLNLGNANTWSAAQTFAGISASAITDSGIAGGGVQCVQASNTGLLSGTGSACGAGGGGAVSSVTNADGTLTISPTTGAVVASLNLAHANTWTALQKHILAGTGILLSNNAAATTLTNQGIDVAEDGAPGSITITTYGVVGTTNMPTFVGQTARGSLASPAVVLANDVLSSFSGRGYTGSGFPAAGRGFVRILSSETWSTTGNGTYISFVTTPNATTAPTEALRIENSGGITEPATVTGGDKGAGSINVGSFFIAGTAVTLPITLANGGTSNGLTASAGGIVWSDASKLNILAGTSTSGQCLLSGNLATPSWGSCGGGVSSVSNADGTLTISPTSGAVVASIALGHANTWTAAQTFNANDLVLGGVTGSTQCLQAGATGIVTGTGSACGSGGGAVSSVTNADGTLTISPTTGAVVASIALGHANTWTAAQTFSASGIKLLGSSTGATTFTSANAGASNFTLTLPAVTDTVAVLGTSQTHSATQTFSGTLNVSGTFQIGGATVALPISLANGGTNNALTASAGGIVWSDSTKLNILAGTSTAGQCLLSGNLVTPSWATCPGGGGTPGGTSGQIQYNNSSAFGGFGFADGTAVTALGNAATAQAFRVYNTVDTLSGPTNYERGVFDWTTTANNLTIGTQRGGTGTARGIKLVTGTITTSIDSFGNIIFGADINNPEIGTNAGGNLVSLQVNTRFGWSPGSSGSTPDTGFARNAAGVVEVNSGTAGTITGSIKARGYISGGSVPVDGGGSCTATSFAGGGTAGTFVAPVCSAGTVAITFAFTAPVGYACDAEDQTTPTTGLLQQTATTTTKATFKATTTASDVVQYKCIAY